MGFRVWGFRGLGFRVQGLGLSGVRLFGFVVRVFGFRIWVVVPSCQHRKPRVSRPEQFPQGSSPILSYIKLVSKDTENTVLATKTPILV